MDKELAGKGVPQPKKKAYVKKTPSQAAKIASLQKQVNSMKRAVEYKITDTSLSFNFDTTGEVPATGQLCLIAGGSSSSTRIGNQVTLKSIQIRASVGFVPGAAATASSTAHLYIVLDKQANGAAATAANVFTGTNFATALRNSDLWQRFTILKHWKHTFTPNAGVTTGYNNVQYALDFYKKLNLPLKYNGASGVIGEVMTNNIFLLAGTDGASDDTIQFSGNCRVVFTDD